MAGGRSPQEGATELTRPVVRGVRFGESAALCGRRVCIMPVSNRPPSH